MVLPGSALAETQTRDSKHDIQADEDRRLIAVRALNGKGDVHVIPFENVEHYIKAEELPAPVAVAKAKRR
jgi:hypothetical protein